MKAPVIKLMQDEGVVDQFAPDGDLGGVGDVGHHLEGIADTEAKAELGSA
jgi:hypothetical protein